MDSGISILFFGTQMALGGAQKLLLDQARWFHGHGNQVTAVFFYDKQGLSDSWRQGLGFPLLTLSKTGPTGNIIARTVGLVGGLFQLWRLLRRGHFDVIETFTYDSNLLALPLAWLAGVKARIATHHGMIERFPRWIERLHSLIINAGIASVLVSVSSKTSEQAVRAGIKPQHLRVIPNGIPPLDHSGVDRLQRRSEMGLEDADILLLSVGRLVYQKGHEYLIRAVPMILSRFPRVKVMICGDGALRAELAAEVSGLNLAGSVSLQGNRSDLNRFLESADIFVLPSRWEGLPIALLEAMGSGLPVVATQVEGVEEVVQHGVQGFLVPPGDTQALAHALLELIQQPGLRTEMGNAARRRIDESYTIDIMCTRYQRLMLDLLQDSRVN